VVESQPSKLLVAGSSPVSRSSEGKGQKQRMFEQAAIAVQDEKKYAELHKLIDAAFKTSDVEVFLNRVIRHKLRVRDFETVLNRGFLGKEAIALYKGLPVSDQGLTRERYLWLVEQVSADLRQRYLKAYAYY
jgi:hypothetical protein